MNLLRRIRHRIAHLFGMNCGRVETWWEHPTLTTEERLLALHAITVAQAERIEVLERALRDCLSTDKLDVIVTAERQEAWIAALRGDS